VDALARLALLSLGTAALVTAPLGRDRGQSSFALDVDVVVFNLTVTDGHGRHVSGLTKADFHVSEDNRPQNVAVFSAEGTPTCVGLVIDNSGSMSDKRAEVTAAALAFVDAGNSDDEMFVVTFNEEVALALPAAIPFTRDPGEIRSALLRTMPRGLTALYDALAVGIEHVQTGRRGRMALVALSDGGDNASRHGLDDVLRLSEQSSATIYTIGIQSVDDRDQNPGVLKKIAGRTGGRAYFPKSLADLAQVWRDIADGIHNQYTIGYYSTNHRRDGRFRRVRITAGRNGDRNLRVTTRDGYWAPPAKDVR